ncbi:hypothetical protein [Phormidesmis priestleyi]|uniref:hypothetical protein n=1 Tax=Phormidesmis priestleyi TaxID=268141 RepID=UPI00083A043E|nr:hypothetical protein [Phormidesmis priestleyi]
MPHLDQLPFLKSLCWQGETPSIANLTEVEVLQLYERNWRLRGVLAGVSTVEQQFIRNLADKYHSWLANDL